jgi:hypothetical protein
MSDSQCKSGDTTGFPVVLAQSLHTNWPATSNSQRQLQSLIVPTDFSLQWQNNGNQNCNISVKQTLAANGIPGVFQVSGFSPDGSTITYGSAQYRCSGVISIVQNQHSTFSQDPSAQYEMILAFQIVNKSTNPSSPDVILLCRPLSFKTSGSNTSFWNAVDVATTQQSPQHASVDMSTFFGYNASLPMPMITYQTCMPVKIFNYGGQPYTYGSLKIRVNVVPQPIHVVASPTGLGKCSTINKYTLITTGNGPLDVFGGGTNLQFRDGFGSDLYPTDASRMNLVTNSAPTPISAFSEVLQKFEILVPAAYLGKSLAEIANAQAPPPARPSNKAMKCYSIDPRRDIVGDQIMVDPTTGQSLQDTKNQDDLDATGGDLSALGGGNSSGIMPGDIEQVLTSIAITIGTIALLAYVGFIIHMLLYRENGFHNSLPHILGFIVCFIALVLFSAYVDK